MKIVGKKHYFHWTLHESGSFACIKRKLLIWICIKT